MDQAGVLMVDHWIDGTATPPAGGLYLDSTSPRGGAVVARVARGGRDDVDAAARSAARACAAWAAAGPVARGRLLRRLEERVRTDRDRLAALEAAETGKPAADALAEVEASADYLEFYAAAARFLEGEVFPAVGAHVYAQREPYGVVGVITPWNYPLNQACRSVAPALAAGNAVVLKPSELTSATAVELARLATAGGFPDGVLNVVCGTGAEAGEALVGHPRVRRVSFTGSVRTGRRVAALAADRLVPATLELGGKSPAIVFADADLPRAARTVAESFVANAGQTCSAPTRLLVERAVERRVAALVAEAAGRVRPGIDVGPLISEAQHRAVVGHLQDARALGTATVEAGTREWTDRAPGGWFVEPAVLTGVTNDMRIAREEVFGPVLVVIPFDTEEEAVALANDSEYGLVGGVWTRDVDRALRVAGRIECGQVYVNGWGAPIDAPFGGCKGSGYGREKGRAALEEYTYLKSVSIAVEPAAP